MKKISLCKETVIDLFCNKNYNQKEVAEYFSVSRATIGRFLKNHNISKKQKLTKELLEEEYINKDKTIKEIAIELKYSEPTISTYLKKYNINKISKKDTLADSIINLYKSGYNYNKIRKELNCSVQTVYTVLEEHGLKEQTHKFDKFSKEELYDLYHLQNLTLEQTAKALNSSTAVVNRYIIHFNITKKHNSTVYDIEQIKKLYLDNDLTIKETGFRLGIPATTLQKILNKHEIKKKHKKDELINDIKQLCALNITIEEIGNQLGISRTYTGQLINSNDIDRDYKGRETYIERVISEFLSDCKISFIKNDRNQIKPKEIDFYLPDYNIGIELCGLYWHSTKFRDSYHIKDKYLECKEKGIQLITIFEDEIVEKEDIVLNRLFHKLRLKTNKIYARQCDIREITNRQGIDFLNSYHIQGAGRNLVYLGAFYKDTLVAVMSFSKPSIAKGSAKVDYELNRFAQSRTVTGIASRLFKVFINKYNPNSIISYSDLRWNNGELYEKLGFEYSHTSEPNYWYIYGQKRISRFSLRKSVLVKNLNLPENTNYTEKNITSALGLYRVYDCGNYVYVWNKK